MKTPRLIAFLTVVFLAAANHSVWACAACYGDTSGSKMGNAAAISIGVMVILMFAMFGAIAAFARHLAWRARHPLPDYNELLSEDEKPSDDQPSNQDPKP